MISARMFILVGIVALWSLAITLWRVTLRHLQLSNHDKAEQEERGPRQRAVRRSLRALLAFNFLVVYPVAIPALIAAAFSGDREALFPGVLCLFTLVLFSVPLASLIRTARQLEQRRLAGVPLMNEPSLWVDGGRALVEAARQGQNPHARHAAVIITAAGIGWVASLASGNENIRWLSLGIGVVGLLLFEYGQFRRKAP
jgi:hypothetical protein